jgi:predicted GIY-YIG superfamily endonuclease
MMQVYIVASQSGATKVGITKSIKRRLRDLQSEGYGSVALYSIIEGRPDALNIEQVTQDLLAEKNIKGEWYDVTPTEAEEAVDRAIELVDQGIKAAIKGDHIRMRAHRERIKDAGIARVLLRVHESYKKDIEAIARTMLEPR